MPETQNTIDQEDDVPTYVYACTECDHGFEAHQAFSDDALTTCPNCGGKLRKVFNSVGIVFKGSGFYRTDSRGGSNSSSDSATSSTSSASSNGSDSGSSGASSSSDSSKSTAAAPKKDATSSSSTSSSTSSSGSAA